MEKIPLELFATVSEYLQIIDIFSLLHLNRSFNKYWANLEYWSIVCKGRINYNNLLLNEFNFILEDLKSFNLSDDCQNGLIEKDKNDEYYGFKLCSLLTNLQNLKISKQTNYFTKLDESSILCKVFFKRRLKNLNLVQLTSIFQDVNMYRCDKKIIAVLSPLIAAISNHFLEIYELSNEHCLNGKDFVPSSEKSFDVKTKLVTRINMNFLQDLENPSLSIISPNLRRNKIIKWIFFDKNTILCTTKDYGIYLFEVGYFSERIILKEPLINGQSGFSKVIIFEMSGDLIAIGSEDGVVDIWRLCSNFGRSNFEQKKWYLIHESTIHYEHTHSQKSLIHAFEELPSPLTWVSISHTCYILLTIYKGIVNEIRIFSINNSDFNNKPKLLNKISLKSDIQMCQIDPKGRFIICVDSNKEIYPKTRFYSLSSGKLLLVQNFRIICPIFTPCGHLMIGAYRTQPSIPIEKSLKVIKSSKVSPKYINAKFMNCYFISIWSVPSLKEIFSFNCGESEQIINIRLSRTRSSTSIVTTTVNKNSSDYIDGSIVKTSSNVYFISHDLFTLTESTKLNFF